jgi:hypothetical protein
MKRGEGSIKKENRISSESRRKRMEEAGRKRGRELVYAVSRG